MIITNKIKEKIQKEYNQWVNVQYAGKDVAERQKLGQFFTPPELSIQMLEKFDSVEGNILDPTVGCGGLLAAAIIAGADPTKCFGIELDPEIALLCRERLAKLGVPRTNIHVGDALLDESYEFNEPYSTTIYFKVENLGFNKVKMFVEKNKNGKVIQKEFTVDYAANEESIKKKFKVLYQLFSMVNGKDVVICSEKLEPRMKFMNAFFKKYLGKKIDCKKGLLELN